MEFNGQQTALLIEFGETQAHDSVKVILDAVEVLIIVGVNPQLQVQGVLYPSVTPEWLAFEVEAHQL